MRIPIFSPRVCRWLRLRLLASYCVVIIFALLLAQAWQQASRAARQELVEPPKPISPNRPALYRSRNGQHKLHVTNAETARDLEERGARLIADYGAFQVFEVVDELAQTFSTSESVEVRDEENLILLNTGALDTTEPRLQQSRGVKMSLSDGESSLHLVQFAGPIKPEWYEALTGTGVRIVSYIPNNAYLIDGDSFSLARFNEWASQTDYVQWDGEYQPDYKIDPSVRRLRQGKESLAASDALFAIQLVANAASNQATLQIITNSKTEPVRSQFSVLQYLNVIVKLPIELIEKEIARRPDVVSVMRYIEPVKMDERQSMILAGNLNGTSPGAGDYLAWLAAQGLTQAQFNQSGFAVNVSDSGIDNATTTPGHFGLYVGGSTSAMSRVIYNRLEGTPNANSTLQGCDGHGNLNAHILAGFVPSGAPFNVFPHADAQGFRYGLGVAPFVKVGSSVVFDPNRFTFPNFSNLESKAYEDSARISSNSWGSSVSGAYNVDSQAYDALVRDAQPTGATFSNPGNQEMVLIFSAGNSGPLSSSVGSPGTAKNVITVGAAESVQSIGGADACSINDSVANSANDIADFSARGPTTDGRKKPDLVAPGTHVSGGVAQATLPPASGQALPCYTGAGICGGVNSTYFPTGQQFYSVSSGTSHAAPAVTGAAALLRQRFLNAGINAPSPAMTKAALMNTTRYLTGVNANDTLWSNVQGMGEVHVGNALGIFSTPTILRDQLAADIFSATGQMRAFTGTVADGSKPFRVTLAWTDTPGPTVGNAYVNNLDLEVTIGGQTYRGNTFNGAFSTTGGSADPRNNVENVFLPAGVTGPFVVRVIAANIAGDGVPNSGGVLDQDFALVVNNATETTLPVIVNGNVQIAVEGCAPGNGAIDPGETVTVNLPLQNIGTTSASNLVATLQVSGGVINSGSAQTYGPLTAGGAAISRPFTFTAGGTCGGTLIATFLLQDGATNLGTVTHTFTLGTSILNTATFSSPATITIPTNGTASSYPSTINVSGMIGTISNITVRLNGLTHSFPDDVDVLLVSPSGQRVILMSDAGGEADAINAVLTFDDTAMPLPDTTLLFTGSYSPVNYGGITDTFPSPAPSGPYPDPPRLSLFSGTTPNGAWSLYVVDDSDTEGGSIQGGWSLTMTTAMPACCSTAGCSTITVAPPTLPDGTVSTPYTQTFMQTGGAASLGFGVTGTLPAGLSLSGGVLSGTPTQVGDFAFTITAVDINNCIGIRSYSLRINCSTLNLTPNTLVNGAVGSVYSQTLTATGSGTRTFSIASGTLPPGLSFSPSGLLSGTPTQAGSFTFQVNVTDANNCSGSSSYTLVIPNNGLQYYPLAKPIRLFDTRAPIPEFSACAYLSQPLIGGQEIVRQARVTCDGLTIPANAQAITGNATVVSPAGGGFLTLWPNGQNRPPVSNLNYVAGQIVPNSFTIGLGEDGQFRVFSIANTDFIVDVTGYFAPPSANGLYYHPLPRPIRLFDTRAPIPGFSSCDYLNQPLLADQEFVRQARIGCDGLAIPADAQAIVGNATVTGPAGGGFLTLWPDGQMRPPVSNLNYEAGQTVPNAFTVGLGSNGQFRVYSIAQTHFVVDVTGYYSPSLSDANGTGLLYSPLPRPIRLFDTRAPIPGFAACEYLSQPLASGQEFAKQARITCDGVTIASNARVIVGNATVVSPMGDGFLTLWPNGFFLPPVSNLNYVVGQIVPNAFTVSLGNDGQFRMYSIAQTHFLTDVTGYYAP